MYLISICIPTYNKADTVYNNVRKLLDLPYDWIQVVVTDDSTNDETFHKLASITDDRFKYVRNSENLGYENLAHSLYQGDGRYCLLLSDSDYFGSTDWQALKRELEEDATSAVLQFGYYDEKELPLNLLTDTSFSADTYRAYYFAFSNFLYSAGIIIRREALYKCKDDIIRKPLIWALYSQQVLVLHCIKYGGLRPLNCVKVIRADRKENKAENSGAWSAGMEEPYWSINSRIGQFKQWIAFFREFDMNSKYRKKFGARMVCDCLNHYRSYYEIINSEHDEQVFKYYNDLMDRDREPIRKQWMRRLFKIFLEMSRCYIDTFKRIDIPYFIARSGYTFLKLYRFFIKESVKGFRNTEANRE